MPSNPPRRDQDQPTTEGRAPPPASAANVYRRAHHAIPPHPRVSLEPSAPLTGHTLFGEGRLAEFDRLLQGLGFESLLLVADETAYRVSGAQRTLGPSLARRPHAVFTAFQENPSLENIEAGIAPFGDRPFDAVVGLGGGSALDVAKIVALCSGQEAPPREIITGAAQVVRPGLPVIAVPTTSGTGAHVTHFSAVYVDGEKYSLAHPSMRPAAAIIDPELTYSMPARVTAATGLDALCQATESLWAVGSTEQSRQHAAEAIRLSMEHLEAAVRRPNPEDRRGMCLAAHRAGQAIDVSKTTAAHALAYALTTDYRLPHGMAAALSLPPLLEFNAAVTDDDCADPRGPEHVRGMLGRIVELMECPTPFHAARRLTVLLESIDAPATLSEVGIATEPERLRLASRVNAERLSNNPRRLAQADVERLLASIA